MLIIYTIQLLFIPKKLTTMRQQPRSHLMLAQKVRKFTMGTRIRTQFPMIGRPHVTSTAVNCGELKRNHHIIFLSEAISEAEYVMLGTYTCRPVNHYRHRYLHIGHGEKRSPNFYSYYWGEHRRMTKADQKQSTFTDHEISETWRSIKANTGTFVRPMMIRGWWMNSKLHFITANPR